MGRGAVLRSGLGRVHSLTYDPSRVKVDEGPSVVFTSIRKPLCSSEAWTRVRLRIASPALNLLWMVARGVAAKNAHNGFGDWNRDGSLVRGRRNSWDPLEQF